MDGLTPNLYTEGGIISAILADGTKVFNGGKSNKFVIELSCGGFWVLYTSAEVEIRLSRYTVRFVNSFSGIYRLAYLGKNANSLATFDKYSDTVPRKGDFDYTFSSDSAELTFSYPTYFMSGKTSG